MILPSSLNPATTKQHLPGIQGHLHGFQPGVLTKFCKALANVRVGTGNAKMLIIGESTSQGYGSTPSNLMLGAWPRFMCDYMADSGLPAVRGLSPAQPGWNVDTKWAPTGWVGGTNNFLGFDPGIKVNSKNNYWASAAGSNSMVFTADVSCDRFDVYTAQFTTTPAISIQATGGSATNLSAGQGGAAQGAILKTTVSAGSLASNNAVTITCTGANASIVAIEPWRSDKSQILVSNVAMGSSTSIGWTSVLFSGVSAMKCVQAYAPDATFIMLGMNDALNSVALATTIANYKTIRDTCQLSGDVIFVTAFPTSNATWHNNYTAYLQMTRQLGCPVIDWWQFQQIAGGFNAYNTAGFMFDGVHGNSLGYADLGRTVANVLRQAI